MKGVFIDQQLEFRLEVPKDGAEQGDSLPCTLTVKNHGSASRVLGDLILELGCGDPKSVADKDADFEKISSAELSLPWEIAPQQQKNSAWTFALDKNCAVTEKSHSMLFRFGSTSGTLGRLGVAVKPHAYFAAVMELLETSFQFIRKGEKSSKGWMNAKFKPSASKKFSMLNELVLGMRFEGTALLLRFMFNVKKFEGAGTNQVNVKKAKTEVEKRLEENEYLISGGFMNHEALEAAIAAALETVATGF
jgi:hypothetical protein